MPRLASEVKLDATQIELLRELRYATGRSGEGHAELQRLGLVVCGKSRFGNWVKLTELGREAAQATVATPVSAGVRLDTPAEFSMREAVSRTGRATAKQAESPPPSPLSGEALPTSSGPVDAAVNGAPNAVRVIKRNKISYYPLYMYGLVKHETRCCVRTENQLFRTATLEASRQDVVFSGFDERWLRQLRSGNRKDPVPDRALQQPPGKPEAMAYQLSKGVDVQRVGDRHRTVRPKPERVVRKGRKS